jgi:hypothetical protein
LLRGADRRIAGIAAAAVGSVSDQSSMSSSPYWQASQSGSSIRQALTPSRSGAAGTMIGACEIAEVTETALSLPSVPFSVDFSTWVADRDRR